MLKLHKFKLFYKYVHTTLPVYLQNLPFIFNKTVHAFNTRIHDNIHRNRAKHNFAKRCIRHDIPLLILILRRSLKICRCTVGLEFRQRRSARRRARFASVRSLVCYGVMVRDTRGARASIMVRRHVS